MTKEKSTRFTLIFLIILVGTNIFAIALMTDAIDTNTISVRKIERSVNYLRSASTHCNQTQVTENTSGLYNPATTNIKIFSKGRRPHNVIRTAYHEVGHYVWYEWLSYSIRKEYRDIFNQTTEWVSDYAKTEVDEDFAETYMEYALNVEIPSDRKEFFETYHDQIFP